MAVPTNTWPSRVPEDPRAISPPRMKRKLQLNSWEEFKVFLISFIEWNRWLFWIKTINNNFGQFWQTNTDLQTWIPMDCTLNRNFSASKQSSTRARPLSGAVPLFSIVLRSLLVLLLLLLLLSSSCRRRRCCCCCCCCRFTSILCTQRSVRSIYLMQGLVGLNGLHSKLIIWPFICSVDVFGMLFFDVPTNICNRHVYP